jgi:hypothetical protein
MDNKNAYSYDDVIKVDHQGSYIKIIQRKNVNEISLYGNKNIDINLDLYTSTGVLMSRSRYRNGELEGDI